MVLKLKNNIFRNYFCIFQDVQIIETDSFTWKHAFYGNGGWSKTQK